MKIIIFLLLIFSSSNSISKVIHQETSQYSEIIIEEKQSIRCLRFQAQVKEFKHQQGCINTQSDIMVFKYSKALLTSLFVNPKPKRVLVIGLGAGIFPKALHTLNPEIHVDIVEIDHSVEKIANNYFNFPKVEGLKVFIEDGRVFVNRALKQDIQYDLIVLDAFNSEYIPEHLMTFEFLTDLKALLTKNGVVASNTFSESSLYNHESVTYKAVFGGFYNIQPDGNTANRVIIATNSTFSEKSILKNARLFAEPFQSLFGADVNELLSSMSTQANWDESARLLTDDYSPSNALKGESILNKDMMKRFTHQLNDLIEKRPLAVICSAVVVLTAFLWFVIIFLEKTALIMRAGKA